jgi:hypothetical protein
VSADDRRDALVQIGEALLGRTHGKQARDRWRVWYATLSEAEKRLYREGGGKRPRKRRDRMSDAKPDPRSLRAGLAQLLATHDSTDEAVRRFDEAQNELQWELFQGSTEDASEARISPDDPRLAFVLDALATLAVREPEDAAHPWNRAGVLSRIGRHGEAAADFLEAARRFEREVAHGDGLTGDEDAWADAARLHAAESFVRAEQPLAAQALLALLADDDRDRVQAAIEMLLVRDARR